MFICFSCRVFRIVYASRWSEMTTNRSSYIRPAFWKVPGYGADDVPSMTVAASPTLVPPTSSRLSQRRRSSNSGIKKRVHFADELYSGVSQETPPAHLCHDTSWCSLSIVIFRFVGFGPNSLCCCGARNQFNNILHLAARKFAEWNIINWPLLQLKR